MKVLVAILLTFLMGKGCTDKQQLEDMKTAKVTYAAGTRGFNYMITIQNQEVTIEVGQRGKKEPVTTKIPDKQWKELVSEFAKLDLEKLSTYKAPTEKRTYDGALAAGMQIDFKGKQYGTETFDDDFPPAEIEKFVKLVTAFRPSRQ